MYIYVNMTLFILSLFFEIIPKHLHLDNVNYLPAFEFPAQTGSIQSYESTDNIWYTLTYVSLER